MPPPLAPPGHPVFDLIVSELVTVATDLFADYEMPIRRSLRMRSAAPGEIAGAATIRFAGNNVHGALTIQAAKSTVEAWLGDLSADSWELGDTLGEYSNMLLGRLKGRLSLDGFPILLATPTSKVGSEVQLSKAPGTSTWLTFDGPGWQVSVRLDANFEPGFSLQEPTHRERSAEAGELIIF